MPTDVTDPTSMARYWAGCATVAATRGRPDMYEACLRKARHCARLAGTGDAVDAVMWAADLEVLPDRVHATTQDVLDALPATVPDLHLVLDRTDLSVESTRQRLCRMERKGLVWRDAKGKGHTATWHAVDGTNV